MPPRRRRTPKPAAAAGPTLDSLPEDLLLRCLEPLSQDDRFKNVALVSKRLRDACLAPQLLRSLRVHIDGDSDDTLAAATAALQFLTAHAASVQHLDLTIHDVDNEGDGVLDEPEERQMEAAVAGCLAACATAGALRSLSVGGQTPLHGMAWLPALRQLQSLELGEEEAHLCLPAAASRLTALREARLTCGRLELEGRLPPALTRLYLREDTDTAALPAQVAELSALASLHLDCCGYTAERMSRVTRIKPLRCLQIGGCSALPASLSALTQLECLGVGIQNSDAEDAETEAWADAVAAALPRLTRLTTLALSVGDPEFEWGLSAIAHLPRLQRLWLWPEFEEEPYSPVTFDGPCLASLRWLALRWEWLEGAAAALRGAPQLEYVCSLDTPAPAPPGEEDEADEAQAAWDAAWDVLATHAPLRCFAFESHNQRPSCELVDALLGLKTRRPALHVQRLPHRADIKHYCSSESFAQMMGAPEVAPPPL